MQEFTRILRAMGFDAAVNSAEQFRAEEDGSPYQVWKLNTDRGSFVLKKTTPEEKQVYEAFFREDGPAPRVFGFSEGYMLMEYVPGSSMSVCSRDRLIRVLDVLIESQDRFWEDTDHNQVGYSFEKSLPNRQKRLAYLGDLQQAYSAYLAEFCRVPRSLCNDDMLPFNVLADENRAVILDWEYAGILPYPCALARFLAFGEEAPGVMFYMTEADRQFALDYYYENLVNRKGISRPEFDRTMDLFFLKEYSEWVYCAALEGDFEMEYCKKYGAMARNLARKLGY